MESEPIPSYDWFQRQQHEMRTTCVVGRTTLGAADSTLRTLPTVEHRRNFHGSLRDNQVTNAKDPGAGTE